MFRLLASWFVLAFIWDNFAKCTTECEFSNLDYKNVVSGIEGKVKPSEPLYRDVIKAELPTLTYSLLNVTFTGMKSCEAIHVQCDKNSKNDLTFQYYIQCPHISIIYKYEAEGQLDTLLINGHGTASVDAVDYVIMFDGLYENVISEDQKPYPVIKKYTISTDPKGIVKFQVKNLYHGDKEREELANRFFNENWREMEKMLRSPTIDSFMELFVENLNAYSRAQ